ncbi:MAG: hypothetical protein H7641_07370 [Candidatus Heimdallarchaeota archaeon]|nr:hypothetical protein [Candidatus Heimdallarchaeota archaeon]MCK4877383.1 hypothetical protein [Candidatus Heimdallarchaeota archaeon]
MLTPFIEGKNLLNSELNGNLAINTEESDSNINVNFINAAKSAEENQHNLELEKEEESYDQMDLEQLKADYNKTFDDVLDEFQPNVNVSSIYSKNEVSEEINNGNLTISLPSQGQYNFEGNVSEIESQYIQNSGAENEVGFYSVDAINAGLSLERVEESRSFEGSYVWKFFSSNTETMSYALYQQDIDLYDIDTRISYNYLLEINSSIQNVVNSSLIFDLVFDTCRIMVIHWHYTNINPPLIGENTTSPFIVYRLLKNSSWNNEWNNYSLELSELFNENDPYIPTTIKSVGIYVISPEFSECSLLIDNFEIRSSVSADYIELKTNGIAITSTSSNSGIFNLYVEIGDGVSSFEYAIYWSHNSSFIINANYSVLISGTVEIITENHASINEITTYIITKTNLSIFASIINITYPAFWSLIGEIKNFDILANESLDGEYNLLSLNNTNQSDLLYCEFAIPNLIESADFSSLTIFETIDATFSFNYEYTNNVINLLWFSDEDGGTSVLFENETLIFTIPPWITNGSLDIVFIITDHNGIGYTNATFLLERFPAQLQITNQIVIPHYAIIIVNASYESLISGIEIEEGSIIAYLNNESINVIEDGNQFQLLVSSYYLSCGDYLLEVWVSSTTHSSIIHTVGVHVYVSEIEIEFLYEKLAMPTYYLLSFNVLSDSYPVGFAPVMIENSANLSLTGILDMDGRYTCEVNLPSTSQVISITFSIIKLYTVLTSETFEIVFEHLQAEISRNSEDVFISPNITIAYDVLYMNSHDKWYTFTNEEMFPVLDAYIQTDSSRIPVHIESSIIYWGVQAGEDDNNHKLIITTLGPEVQVSLDEEKNQIMCHFIIGSQTKSFSDVSLIYYLNGSFTSSKYQWELFSSTSQEVSENYNLQINDIYVYYSNINITKGSYLILDLVGTKLSGANNLTNLVIPLVSSSGVLAGAITTVIKIYNKKKGMILEI